jgi:hypothetical protein
VSAVDAIEIAWLGARPRCGRWRHPGTPIMLSLENMRAFLEEAAKRRRVVTYRDIASVLEVWPPNTIQSWRRFFGQGPAEIKWIPAGYAECGA